MGKTSVMTLRLPTEVRRGVERLAARSGHKPAQIGARLIDEGLRRREFPLIEIRETAAGRVAYVKGTRLAVYWVAQQIHRGMSPNQMARELELSLAQVNAALGYARVYTREIELDIEEADANRKWIEVQDSVGRGKSQTSETVSRKRK